MRCKFIFSFVLVILLWGGFYSHSKAFNDVGKAREMDYIYKTLDERAEDIDLLARIIQLECGADWCSDELQYLTGAVIINRVDDPRFPNTIRDVIYSPGQYSTVGLLYSIEPSERSIKVAEKIILWGVEDTPPDLVYQANFKQGSEVYRYLEGVYLCLG